MKRSRLCLLALVAALVVAFGLPSSAGRVEAETGVTTPDAARTDQSAYEGIKAAGRESDQSHHQLVRCGAERAAGIVDPTDHEDPNYDWSEFDFAIQNATNAGVRVIASVFRAPSWAERCEADVPGICDPDPDMFADFTEAAAERYDGSGPQLGGSTGRPGTSRTSTSSAQFKGGKKVSPTLDRAMLNKFATRVRAANPTNLVVGGGLAPWQRPGGLGPLDFMRRLLCLKGRSDPRPIQGCSASPHLGQQPLYDRRAHPRVSRTR